MYFFHCYLHLHVVRLLGGEEVGIQIHLLGECDVCRRHIGDGCVILYRGLCQIGKGHGNLHGIFCYACADAPPLVGGFLLFAQIFLHLDEMFLKFVLGLFWLQIGAPGLADLLKLSCL